MSFTETLPLSYSPDKKGATNRRFNTFDIETKGLGGSFLCAVICEGDDCETFLNSDQFCANLLSREGIFYAHNGGKYDTTFLLKYIVSNRIDCEIKFNGSRIMSLVHKGVEIRDSFMLMPSSLEKILKSFSGKGKKNTWNTTDISKLIERCKEDCVALEDCLSRMEGKIVEYGGKSFDNCYSVAGTSFSVFSSYTSIKRIRNWDAKTDVTLRISYFGGRVENFVLGRVQDVIVFDINSMYPSCMIGMVPIGSPIKQEVVPKKLRDTDLINVSLFVKEDEYIGPIPVRDETKVIFPTGRIEGWYFWEELKTPHSIGVFSDFQIKEVWRFKEDNCFGAFVSKFYHERLLAKAKGDTFIDFVCKILLNSLYGKFATLDEHDTFKMLSKESFDYLEKDDQDFALAHIYTVEKDGQYMITRDTEVNRFFGSNVAISSFITAKARAMLYRHMIKHKEALVYVDTDSLHLDASKIKDTVITGKELGALKEECRGSAVYIGAKMYRIKTDRVKRSKIRCMIKGKHFGKFPLVSVFKAANKGFRKFRFDGEENQGRMVSGKAIMKGGEWSYETIKKTANYYDFKRQFTEDGGTKPLHLPEKV